MNILSGSKLLVVASAALAWSLSATPLPAAPLPAPQQSSTASHSTTSSTKKKKSHHRRSYHRQSYQKAPTPERISEIQSALGRGGYYEGQPNGKWDSGTVSALEKFQSANGMNPSGKLDAPSLQKLGLGSSTAGVDAPKPLQQSGHPAASSTSSLPAPAALPTTNPSSASNVSTSTGPAPANPASGSSKPPQQ
jgi:Putative peptidoglycan binding domain